MRRAIIQSPLKVLSASRFSDEALRVIRQFTGIHSSYDYGHLRNTSALPDLIDGLVAECGIEAPTPERVLMDHWREIMGPQWAHRCAPVRIGDGGVLFLATSNASLRSEIQFNKRQLLQKIQSHVGNQVVTDIRLGSG